MNQYQKNMLSRANWPLRIPPSRNVAALLQEQAEVARQIAQCQNDLNLLRKHIQRLYDLDDQIKLILFGPEAFNHHTTETPETTDHSQSHE